LVSDVAAAVRDILAFHLGIDDARIADDARLAEDLGADSLDAVEIFMSCEERFDIDIPNRVAADLVTVADAVRFIESELADDSVVSTGAPQARSGETFSQR
jgi:acyl carrier protein